MLHGSSLDGVPAHAYPTHCLAVPHPRPLAHPHPWPARRYSPLSFPLLVPPAEVGHNFGAIHAFDYCGKDGWGDNTPVDYCKQSENGCSQPNGYGIVPKCSAKPTAFGGGGGTIMSERCWGESAVGVAGGGTRGAEGGTGVAAACPCATAVLTCP